LTFNKTVTDEYDLLGCCYFGTYGGLTNAARELSGHAVSTYYGDTRDRENADIRTLAEEVRRVVRTRLLNPKWIEGMKRHGYKGAGDISKQVGRVYGWEATTEEVDDWIFDDIARTFILDEENRKFFPENNPWAMEEMGRRLLEASSRGMWKADKAVLDALKSSYLETEGWMEEKMGEIERQLSGRKHRCHAFPACRRTCRNLEGEDVQSLMIPYYHLFMWISSYPYLIDVIHKPTYFLQHHRISYPDSALVVGLCTAFG